VCQSRLLSQPRNMLHSQVTRPKVLQVTMVYCKLICEDVAEICEFLLLFGDCLPSSRGNIYWLLTQQCQVTRLLKYCSSWFLWGFCCSEAMESASHFLCYCNKFFSIRNLIWGKPCLHPEDIDNATVGDIVRFIKKSHRFPKVLNCN